MRQGWSVSLFQAAQQWSRMSEEERVGAALFAARGQQAGLGPQQIQSVIL